MPLKICFSVIICAFIGWITNFIAIKMLFHPRRPVRLPGLTIQGIFPKRRTALALNLSAAIEGELLSHKDIQSAMRHPEFSTRLREKILAGFTDFLGTRLASVHPMVGMFLDGAMMDRIRGLLETELDRIVPGLLETAADELERTLDLRQIIQEKIENLSMERLETLLMSIMAREFRFIEMVGAALGALIGLTQGLLFF